MVFAVRATKKGELPLSVDKRKWGKLVTRLDNVSGDVDALLSAVKGALGTGGSGLPGAVEVQGVRNALSVCGAERAGVQAWSCLQLEQL